MNDSIHKNVIYNLHLSLSILSISSLNNSYEWKLNYFEKFKEVEKNISTIIIDYMHVLKKLWEDFPLEVLKEINIVNWLLLQHKQEIN